MIMINKVKKKTKKTKIILQIKILNQKLFPIKINLKILEEIDLIALKILINFFLILS